MRLGDVIQVNPESIRAGYPYEQIEYVDISSVGTGTMEGTKSISLDGAPSRAKRIVRNADTLLATVRPNLRSFLYVRQPSTNTIASTGFAVLRATDAIDPRFLYYTVTNQAFTDYLTANAKGAAYPAVDADTIKRAEIYLPPLSIQQKIAAILSAYDDLIENNLWRIKILEEMARNLYREWFVKFRFPCHAKVRMVDSPLGETPEGWDIVKVGELLEKIKRKKKIKKQDYQLEGEIPVVDQGKDFVGGFTCDPDALHNDPLPIIVFGDHTRILKFIDFPFACGADGTQLLRSNTSRMPMSLFYSVLKSIDLSSFAYARHFKFLKEQEVLLPDEGSAEAYADFVEPLRDHIRSLMRKNNNLRQTRDLLLPKLISGELDISELEIDTGKEAA